MIWPLSLGWEKIHDEVAAQRRYLPSFGNYYLVVLRTLQQKWRREQHDDSGDCGVRFWESDR